MLNLDWCISYSVNNEELDNHHKTLFGIFYRLIEILDNKGDADTFKAALYELVIYSDYHFKAEEKYMREVRYNDIERHIALHNYFISRLSDIKDRVIEDNDELCRELIFFLGNWLKHHVIEEDKRIAL
jgi:hemerythrin-like metal-binding protein